MLYHLSYSPKVISLGLSLAFMGPLMDICDEKFKQAINHEKTLSATLRDSLGASIGTEKTQYILMTSKMIGTMSLPECKFCQFYAMKAFSFIGFCCKNLRILKTSIRKKPRPRIISKNLSCDLPFSWASANRSRFLFV